jgi:hypothetical protein
LICTARFGNGRLGSAAQHCDALARHHELPQVQRITSNKLSRVEHLSHWQRYLANDAQSEWAAREMQVRLDFIPRAGSLRLSAGTSRNPLCGLVEDMSMTSPTLRALGQVVIVYFAISGSTVTAQDLQPGRATFAEMVAFARLASVPCKRLAPDVEGFHALVLQRLIKPPLAQEEIAAKEKDVKRLRDRLGLSRWCKRYAGEMEQARILVQVLRRQN